MPLFLFFKKAKFIFVENNIYKRVLIEKGRADLFENLAVKIYEKYCTIFMIVNRHNKYFALCCLPDPKHPT